MEQSAKEILGYEFIEWYKTAAKQWMMMRSSHFVEGHRAAARICWNKFPPDEVGWDVFDEAFSKIVNLLNALDAENWEEIREEKGDLFCESNP